MKRWRRSWRDNPVSESGARAFALGLRFGYWPCLQGPFVSVSLGRKRFDLWYGLEHQSDGPSANLPKIMYRHRKRGTIYEVIGDAELQMAPDALIDEGWQLVIYRDADGHLWARPSHEFHDGRFEPYDGADVLPLRARS